MSNPYSGMIELIRKESMRSPQGLHIRTGRVITASPLCVDICGLTQSGNRLVKVGNLSFGAGDHLLTLTEDDQLFYILGKVGSV